MPERVAFVQDLSTLAPSDWEVLVAAIKGAATYISRQGTVPEKVAELIHWAESPTGPGLAAIEEAFKTLLNRPPPSDGTTTVGQAFWNVPHPRNPSFTRREAEIAGLREWLTRTGKAALAHAISGVGALGRIRCQEPPFRAH